MPERSLPGAWSLGLMTEADLGNSDDGTGVAAVFVQMATVGHAIAGPVSGRLEFRSAVGPGPDSPGVGTVDVGGTWAINDNWILDPGFNIGVTAEAPDYNPFLGISHRF